MVDYSKGKIYKLVSSHTESVYVGSTCRTLYQRFHSHKSDNQQGKNCRSKELIQYDDVKIILIENYPTTSLYLLQEREKYWIKELNSINFQVPNRTRQEWYQDNKELVKQKDHLRYTGERREKQLKKQSEIVMCESCNENFRRGYILRHYRTDKHLKNKNDS